MPYRCEKCGENWSDEDAARNKHRCFRNCDGKLILLKTELEIGVARGECLIELIPRLPSTIALVLDEYVREQGDYQALHRMCGALEITARFLTFMILADIWGDEALLSLYSTPSGILFQRVLNTG